jgi:hypothetical protein
MTLPDLAALAAEKVPGFERPDGSRCATCDAHGGYFDDSPAALLMAVVQHSLEFHALEQDIVFVRGVRGGRTDGKCRIEATGSPNEDIARAALVALLRANGVETTPATPETTAS